MRENLIKWEKDNGYVAKWVADQLGIPATTYCLIKKGKRTPSIDFAYKFLKAFPNADVLDLMKKF